MVSVSDEEVSCWTWLSIDALADRVARAELELSGRAKVYQIITQVLSDKL